MYDIYGTRGSQSKRAVVRMGRRTVRGSWTRGVGCGVGGKSGGVAEDAGSGEGRERK